MLLLCFYFEDVMKIYCLKTSRNLFVLVRYEDVSELFYVKKSYDFYLHIIMKDTRRMFMISSAGHFDWLMEFISAVVILSQFELHLNLDFSHF